MVPQVPSGNLGLVLEQKAKVKLVKTPLMSTTDAKSLGLNFKYSTNKARELLGWSVKEDLKSGLKKWKLWYVEYSG